MDDKLNYRYDNHYKFITGSSLNLNKFVHSELLPIRSVKQSEQLIFIILITQYKICLYNTNILVHI